MSSELKSADPKGEELSREILACENKVYDVYFTMLEAHAALAHSSYPKLLFAGDPGALVSPAFAEEFAKGLRTCSVVHLGPGAHYLQEDHPEAIGTNVKQWLIGLGVENQTAA